MKTKSMYLNRLIKLGGHLADKHLSDLTLMKKRKYRCDDKGANIEYFSWALKDLPLIFKQWGYGPDGNPRLDGYESLNTLTAAAIWFGLDFDSLSHLFVPGYQEPIVYGGETLSPKAKPYKLITNIYEYAYIMETKTEAKIINLKTIKHEKSNIMSRMRA